MTSNFTLPNQINFQLSPDFRTEIDLKDFKDSMAAFASAVCIVTAHAEDVRIGRTATAIMSLSVTPPTILASIDHGSELANIIRKTGGFSVSALTEKQDAIADAFAGHEPPERRFDFGKWDAWQSGNPRLQETVWSMECKLTGVADIGSHFLFAGGVSALDIGIQRKPLIWHDRIFNGLHPLKI